jgi:hypothetical protein
MTMRDQAELLRAVRRQLREAIVTIDDCLRQIDGSPPNAEIASEVDDVAEFMGACTVAGAPSKTLRGGELYQLYLAWCFRSERDARSHTAFGLRLRALGYRKFRNGAVLYLGLRLSIAGQRIADDIGYSAAGPDFAR